MDRIRIDTTNALAAAVGEQHGVAERDLAALAQPAASALARLAARGALDPAAFVNASESVLDYAASVHGRFQSVVVLGSGSAALVNRALQTALNSPYHNLAAPGGLPRLFLLDDIDPDLVGEFLDVFDPSECLFLVLSRAGPLVGGMGGAGTSERPESPGTIAQFLVFRERIVERLGAEAHKDHVAIVTDADAGSLRAIAQREGYVAFDATPGPLGRGSALAPDALLAAALVGVDVKGIAAGASATLEACASQDLPSNPALLLAAVQRVLVTQKAKPLAAALACGHRLRGLAEWSARLAGEALGFPASLGAACDPERVQLFVDDARDAWFTLLAVEDADHTVKIPSAWPDVEGTAWLAGRTLNDLSAANRMAAEIALARARRPSVTIHFPSVTPHTVGQFLALAELAASVQREWSGPRPSPGTDVAADASALLGRAGFESRRK